MPRNSRSLRCTAVVLAGVIFAGFAYVPILREIGSFLIVEDPLRPAAAIVALGGQAPFRQIEAARLYHAGWAPLVFVVQEKPSDEAEALRELGVKKVPEWELSRQVLIQQGVPAAAIIVPKDKSIGTLEELQAVYKALNSQRSEISDQKSAKNVRGEASGVRRALAKEQGAWRREQRAKGEEQSGKRLEPGATVTGHPSPIALSNATNATNAERDNALPVILVTSKYHTRRTGLIWKYVTEGRSQAIVRATSRDPFDPDRWWQQRSFVLSVVREYLGLVNYYAGFPVAP